MKLYKYQGGDSQSDSGRFTIVVGEHRKDLALQEARNHLFELGRADLVDSLELVEIKDLDSSSIIFSDVEKLR